MLGMPLDQVIQETILALRKVAPELDWQTGTLTAADIPDKCRFRLKISLKQKRLLP